MSATGPGFFRKRLRAGELLTGTFVKTPSPILCEVLGQSRLDAVCLDVEHAPFGRGELDACLQVLDSGPVTPLVRVAAARPEYIMQALDSGAAGVLVPHVRSADQAAEVARWARFGEGGRGYAGSPRAAGYGTRPMAEHRAASANETVVIAQIEDLAALDEIDGIAATEGIDALFIGRIDLTVAADAETPNAPEVIEMVERFTSTARNAGMPVGMFVPSADEVPRWRALGASLFMAGSDHAFVRAGANALDQSMRGPD